jgi:hypothetical protein
MELRVVVAGDRRVTENLILEVRAFAQRFGLEMPGIKIIRQPRVGSKAKREKVRSKNKARPRRSSRV